MSSATLTGPVHIIGAGLLGTSIGLALRRAGVKVWLSDANSEHLQLAVGLGAGMLVPEDADPQLVVVAVPPAVTAEVIVAALDSGAVVTDIASVKEPPLRKLESTVSPTRLSRYVGSHPMAGTERSGPLTASDALFEGRTWAITPHQDSAASAVELVRQLVVTCRARPVQLSPADHDVAVGRISHLPHLMAVLTAAQLDSASAEHLQLAGPGVRDVTRVAGGDPELYSQIIAANKPVVGNLLAEMRQKLDELIVALADDSGEQLRKLLAAGLAGTQLIPGKHGTDLALAASAFVQISDAPGELARLLADIGGAGINVEDLRIDHDPSRPVGFVEVVVNADRVDELKHALSQRDWVIHG